MGGIRHRFGLYLLFHRARRLEANLASLAQSLHVDPESPAYPAGNCTTSTLAPPVPAVIAEESTVAASGLTLAREVPETRIEDVLAHLPMSRMKECGKGEVIYGPEYPSSSIYLLVAGKVRISQLAADRTEVLLDIIRPEEIFGESAFLDSRNVSERATAAETCKVMSWEVSDMEKLVSNRPRLAVALLQIFAQRNAQAALRIESFATEYHRAKARPIAVAFLREIRHLGAGRHGTHDAAHPRPPLAIRRDVPRNRHPLYEPFPQ